MSSYFTSSLNRVVSSIKRTVNELVSETSSGKGGGGGNQSGGGEEVLVKPNCSVDGNKVSAVDLISMRSRRSSQVDIVKKPPTRQEKSEKDGTTKRLSLAEIFGDNAEALPPSHSKLCDSLKKEELNKCTETADTGKQLLLGDSKKRESPSLPSLSTLPEEEGSGKPTANSTRGGVNSSSPGSKTDPTSRGQFNVGEQMNEVKSTPSIEEDSSDPADAVGLSFWPSFDLP